MAANHRLQSREGRAKFKEGMYSATRTLGAAAGPRAVEKRLHATVGGNITTEFVRGFYRTSLYPPLDLQLAHRLRAAPPAKVVDIDCVLIPRLPELYAVQNPFHAPAPLCSQATPSSAVRRHSTSYSAIGLFARARLCTTMMSMVPTGAPPLLGRSGCLMR